jgi:hypothetical protein
MAAIPIAVREALASNYEDLRREALAGAGGDRGVGLALFIRRGMSRWMDTCTEILAGPTVAPPQRHIEEQPHLDPDLRVEVAMVLAQMALLAHSQGATTC